MNCYQEKKCYFEECNHNFFFVAAHCCLRSNLIKFKDDPNKMDFLTDFRILVTIISLMQSKYNIMEPTYWADINIYQYVSS